MHFELDELPPNLRDQALRKIAEEDRRRKVKDLLRQMDEPEAETKKPKKSGSKYHAKKETIDGITFDSRKEAKRYSELSLMQKAGEISGLRLQVPYELLPKQKLPDGTTLRAVKYVADFVYKNCDGEEVIEDTKGFRTPEYKIKRKLAFFRGIYIREI